MVTLREDQSIYIYDHISLKLSWNEKYQIKICWEYQTSFLLNILFCKLCRYWDNVEKYGTARQTTDDNIVRCMRVACWILENTDKHSEYVMLIFFSLQQ
jgi:hypothetical protein